MRKLPVALLVVVGVILSMFAISNPVHAQAPADIRVDLSITDVRLGERFTVAVTIAHGTDMLVNVAPPERSATLQLVEIRPPARMPDSTGVVTRFEYVLAVFALGDIRLQPLRVSWLHADGATGFALTHLPPLTVVTASVPNDTNLRPLKPQLDVTGAPPSWQQPAITAGTAALTIALIAILVLRWRHSVAPLNIPAIEASTAESEARQRLDTLSAEQPLTRGDYDTYYGTIAAVVRDYLEERFEFGARSLTTTELQQQMVLRGVERWQARLVGGLLDRCDSAVYAGKHPDPASADHDLTVAFEIVELSRPAAEARG